jgi:hypothetical protein
MHHLPALTVKKRKDFEELGTLTWKNWELYFGEKQISNNNIVRYISNQPLCEKECLLSFTFFVGKFFNILLPPLLSNTFLLY